MDEKEEKGSGGGESFAIEGPGAPPGPPAIEPEARDVAPGGGSILECVRRGILAIPPTHRSQKQFFRFLRKASSDRRFLEQIRSFRDAVVLSAVREGPKSRGLTLGFAGVRGREGTSLVALTLGLSLGDCAARKVAFFDGRLNPERFEALSRVLDLCQNSVTIQKGFREIAGYCNERYGNVYFLRNIRPERSLEFFSDKRLPGFIDELRENFDFTVLDLPPLLSETAAMFALPHVDRLYLVVEAGRTKLVEIERCMDVAAQAGTKLAGVVINKQTAPWWSRFLWKEFFF